MPGPLPGGLPPAPASSGKPESWASIRQQAGKGEHLLKAFSTSKIDIRGALGDRGLVQKEREVLKEHRKQHENHVAAVLGEDFNLSPAAGAPPPTPAQVAVRAALKTLEDNAKIDSEKEQDGSLQLAQKQLHTILEVLQPRSGNQRTSVGFESQKLEEVKTQHAQNIARFHANEVARIERKYDNRSPYVAGLRAAPISLANADIAKLKADEFEKVKNLTDKLKEEAKKAFDDLLTNKHETEKLQILEAARLRDLLNNNPDWEGNAGARLRATSQSLQEQIDAMWEIVNAQTAIKYPKWYGLAAGQINIFQNSGKKDSNNLFENKKGVHRDQINEKTAHDIIVLLLLQKMKTESDPKKRKTIKIDVEHSWRGQGHYENSTVKAAMLLAARAIAMGCEVESECTDENFLAFIEEQKEKAALDKKKLDKIEEEEKKIEDKEHAQRTHYQTTLSAGCDRVEELLGKIQAKIEQIKKQESTLPLPASVAEQNRILQVLLQELKDLHMEFTKQSVSVRTHIAHLQTEYGNRRRQDAYQELLELDHRALVCQAKAHELVGPPDANNVYPPNGFSQYMIDPSPRGGPRPARGSWDNFRLDFEDFANGFAQSHNDLQAKEAQLQAVVLSARP